MSGDPLPDRFELGVRFGCGWLFGAVVAFFFVIRRVFEMEASHWGLIAGIGLVTGLLAMRYGDRFWELLCDWFRWRF